ncbi:TPA: hypothetical protein ACPZCG_003740, partial [Yersinia enterocolitica]
GKQTRQAAPLLGCCCSNGFALVANICNSLQNVAAIALLTFWLTSCFKRISFGLRDDQIKVAGLFSYELKER